VLLRGSLGADPNEEASLREVVAAVDCSQDLRQFTASATAAVETGKELAERQQAALDSASQDLLCSPDIIRSPPLPPSPPSLFSYHLK